MRYRDLSIETLRQAPNIARSDGEAFLHRGGYLTRAGDPTPLGRLALTHLRELAAACQSPSDYFARLEIPVIAAAHRQEFLFALSVGEVEVLQCTSCGFAARRAIAPFSKEAAPPEAALPRKKIATPDCHTIEALAGHLGVPKEKTAKALLYTRPADGRLVFAVVRGDMQLSEAKLRGLVGEVRAATTAEIERAGATPGYASPIGLQDALIVVDDLIPQSGNLVSGANEPGYHLLNVVYGRDYAAEIIADLALAEPGAACPNCGSAYVLTRAASLAEWKDAELVHHFESILLALAEVHHDERGLTLPHCAAPFEVYLMHIPAKEMDTRAAAEELYGELQEAGIAVLFDERDERAGVKFNDADLIGCPVRVTVGERGLRNGMVEVKPRQASESQSIVLAAIISSIKSLL